ncbi:MAG TPA: OsmC family protein [Longimicrobium sp.]|jgi:putative redox protein|uniref:OsmC family protein n=1 Tax=Longimicrobium sp. TaxID=2029185 RepID=UPI002EDAC7F9
MQNVASNDVVARIGREHYRTEIEVGGKSVVVDEPASLGGGDSGPTPYDMILGSIGACTAMTVRMYADRKGWPLESVTVRLRQARSYQQDCEDCGAQALPGITIERELVMEGALDDEQRERLTQIADRCPVKQALERGVHVQPAQPA